MKGEKLTANRYILASILVLLFLSLTACGPKKPVLYPNPHLKDVGQTKADSDITDCIQRARAYVKSNKGAEVAKRGARDAAVGAATGAAVSAVLGRDVGKSAAAGAAGGGAHGVTRGVFDAAEPDPIFKRFVHRCLSERGYEIIGWQ